jgi:hypothetical protein
VCCKALVPHQEHHSNTDSNHGSHDRHTVWCGLTALGGIYLFFLVERLVGMCSERKRTRKEKRLQVILMNTTDCHKSYKNVIVFDSLNIYYNSVKSMNHVICPVAMALW